MLKKISVWPVFFVVLPALFSCKKGPGEGGSSSIKGFVNVVKYNPFFTVILDTFVGVDEDVYIIYGDDISAGDRTWVGPDGWFEFKYLREGDYRVYLYSDDTTLSDSVSKIPVIRHVEITAKNQEADAGVFYLQRN